MGGYELAYECRGEGSPTIITEAGYDSAGTSTFSDLLDPLATISRVCAYDRAGTGVSDARPDADGLTVMDQVAELHALLDGAGIAPSYVLVGHSYGGFVSRLFAAAYPAETAGLLLIESSHE
ncbi:MAG: alpha/beta hydrolase, partial [Actinomycetota bacterium]